MLIKKNPKHFPKYPIDDCELYRYPDIYGINEYNINKPNGSELTIIPQHRFATLIQIFDFIQTFSHKLGIARFSLYELYSELTLSETQCERSYCLLYTIYISLIQLILTHVSSIDSNDLLMNNDNALHRLRKKTDKMNDTEFAEYIELSWLELMYIVLSSETFSSANLTSNTVISRLNNETLTLTQFNSDFTYDDKISLLQSLMNMCYDTEIIRELIRSEHEKRDEIKKSKKDLDEEMKVIDARKRVLERQEKFTQPYLKVELLTNKLNTLNQDNQHLTRLQLSKLRKEVEHEREQFKSVIKEMECINGRKVDIMNKIEKLQNEIYDIPTIGKKWIGVDGRGYKYFFFPWENERIFMKCGKEWRELVKEEDIQELINRLSEKGVKEKALKSKLKKIYPKRMNMGKYKHNNNNDKDNGYYYNVHHHHHHVHNKRNKHRIIDDDDDDEYSPNQSPRNNNNNNN
jgi:archaellum component FlaC